MSTRVLTRYLAKELFTHSLTVTLIVVLISIARRFGNYLEDAASGQLPAETVVQLVGIRTIVALPSLMPIGLYFAVLLVLRRLRADNEVTALEAAGVPPMRVRSIVVAFAVCFAVVDGVLALSVRPRAARKFVEVAAVLRLTNLQPGRFYELGDANDLILFIGSKAPDGTLEDVFLQKREGEQTFLTSCARATEQLIESENYRFLLLSEGYAYEFGGEPRSEPLTITHYREMLLRLPLRQMLEGWPENARYTSDLLRSADNADAAELQWRLAMPVSTVLLTLMAIALAASRLPGIPFVALALYVAYVPSLGVAKTWVEHDQLSAFPGLWLVHAAWMVIISIALWSLRSRPRNTR
jgi:lipopolysaccharide export system permease protein